MLIVIKSGSLIFLEPLGPVQACNGIALPLCAANLCLMIWLGMNYSVWLCYVDALCDCVHMFGVWGLMCNHFVHYLIVTELCAIFGS